MQVPLSHKKGLTVYSIEILVYIGFWFIRYSVYTGLPVDAFTCFLLDKCNKKVSHLLILNGHF
jgi:hypothetical protein